MGAFSDRKRGNFQCFISFRDPATIYLFKIPPETVHKVRFLNFNFVLEFPERVTIFNRLRAINYCVNSELLRFFHSRDITSEKLYD